MKRPEDARSHVDWLEPRHETNGMVIGVMKAVPEERLPEDLQVLYDLLDPALPRLEIEATEQALRAPGVTVFAVLHHATNRLIGVATVVTAPTLPRKRAWAEDLVVHPDYRGRRIGEALMDACAEAAVRTGARAMEGTVHPTRKSRDRPPPTRRLGVRAVARRQAQPVTANCSADNHTKPSYCDRGDSACGANRAIPLAGSRRVKRDWSAMGSPT